MTIGNQCITLFSNKQWGGGCLGSFEQYFFILFFIKEEVYPNPRIPIFGRVNVTIISVPDFGAASCCHSAPCIQ
jgi:hypothetical protein